MAFEYTSLDQVRAILPKDVEITAESEPSIAQANVWLTQAEATYDSARGVATLQADKDAAAALCSGEVAYKIQLTRSGGSKEFADSAWMQYHKDFLAATGQTESGVTAGGLVPPSSYTMNAPDNPDSTVNPIFKREQVHNW